MKKKLTPYQRTLKFRKEHPEKNKARIIFFSAKRNGTVVQQPCVECGNKKSEAHHEDYSKPLEIIWLCKKHHILYDSARRIRLIKGN